MKISFSQSGLLLLIISLFILIGCEKSGAEKLSRHSKSALLNKNVYEWSYEEKVKGFRNIDQIWNTRRIEAGDTPYLLTKYEHPDLPEVQFEYKDSIYGLEAYLAHNQILGLLVIKNDTIVLEHYAEGNTPESKWISFSVAKSVVSLLVGVAVKEGHIRSLNDPISDYLPELAGSEYEKVSILQAMQMTSGIKWNEGYNDPDSDIRKYILIPEPSGMLSYLKKLPRIAPPGERFNYNTAETRLVGLVLRAAIGENLSPYLSKKIWKPFGMESPANWWLLGRNGPESGGCCISATLRDYGRIGLFTISEYEDFSSNQTILPKGWMKKTTNGSPAADYYGALWWLDNNIDSEKTYAAYGVFGQMIWVDPTENLVVVTHSAWPEAQGNGQENYYEYNDAFISAITKLMKE